MLVRNRSSKMPRWSSEEVEILKKYRRSLSSQELVDLLPHRTVKGIENRCCKLGLLSSVAWSDRETDQIRKYTEKGWKINTIAYKIGKTRSSVATFKHLHGLTNPRSTWTTEEDNLIKNNWERLSDEDLRDLLCNNHTKLAIRERRRILGLTDKSRNKSQGEKQIRQILDIIPYQRFDNYRAPDLDYLELDFYYPDIRLAIEFNGEQHYQPIQFGGISRDLAIVNFRRQQRNDKRKRQLCKRCGIFLLVVPYCRGVTAKRLSNLISEVCDRTKAKHSAVDFLKNTVLPMLGGQSG